MEIGDHIDTIFRGDVGVVTSIGLDRELIHKFHLDPNKSYMEVSLKNTYVIGTKIWYRGNLIGYTIHHYIPDGSFAMLTIVKLYTTPNVLITRGSILADEHDTPTIVRDVFLPESLRNVFHLKPMRYIQIFTPSILSGGDFIFLDDTLIGRVIFSYRCVNEIIDIVEVEPHVQLLKTLEVME